MSRHPFTAGPEPFTPQPDAPVERRRSRSERRAWQRLPVRVAVRQQVLGENQGPSVLLAQSSDLGLGGMRIWRRSSEQDPDLRAHTEVELAFELPGTTDLLTVRGEVVFDAPGDPEQGGAGRLRATGVRFCGLSEREQELLREFLTKVPYET